MLSACERQLVFRYLRNAASRIHHTSPETEKLAEWVAENWDLALTDNTEELEQYRPYKHEEMSAREWRDLRETLEGGHSACDGSPPDRTAARLQSLGRRLDLAADDVAILELLLRYRVQPVLESLIDLLGDHRRSRGLNVANPYLVCLLGIPSGAFLSRLTGDAPLIRAGLVSVRFDGDLEIVQRLYRLIYVPGESGLDVRRLLLHSAAPGELEWSDFDHVAEERDHIEGLMSGALRSGSMGVNVLVYGPPGTGKTEFCKTLAARLGADLYNAVIGIQRPVVLLQPAALEHGDAVRQRHGFDLVVGHVDGGRSMQLVQPADLEPHPVPELRVEVREGLVHQQHARPPHQRPADGDPLLLAARKLARLPVDHLTKSQHLDGAVYPFPDLRFVDRRPVRAPPEPEAQVLRHTHVRIQGVGLEHHAETAGARGQVVDPVAPDQDVSRSDVLQAGQQAEGGGLAASGRPEQYQELPLLHRQAERVQGDGAVAELLGHPGEIDRRHAAPTPSPRRRSGLAPGPSGTR